MCKLVFSNVSFSDIKKCVDLKRVSHHNKTWLKIDNINLKQQQLQQVQILQDNLFNLPLHVMNEITIWGRAIYPLLLLTENDNIQALAGIALKANYKNFSLEGVVDGVIAKSIDGYLEKPYFVIVEAKRGIKAKNPIPQLYAELLATAMLNQQHEAKESQRIFGCYTIIDLWVFVQAEVFNMESKRPTLIIQTSREYNEKYEAITILKTLENIIKITTSN